MRFSTFIPALFAASTYATPIAADDGCGTGVRVGDNFCGAEPRGNGGAVYNCRSGGVIRPVLVQDCNARACRETIYPPGIRVAKCD